MAGMAGMVDANAGTIRGRIHALNDAVYALPSTLRAGVPCLAGGAGASGLWALAGHLVSMLVAGWLAHRVYDLALCNYRVRLFGTPADGFAARALQLAIGIVLDFAGIAVFALGALAVFFARWLPDELQRIAGSGSV